uniref:CxC6 domain-containing protein n=1 Tax=Elaeophora elaphi TaxID=1147741 RepID=A0A0R3RHD2_9BILA
MIIRRKRAFDLAQIESNLAEEEEQRLRWGLFRIEDSVQLRDKMCRKKCDENLRLGLDMVKVHTALGSISMPSVVDENDLKLFCRLDDQHSWCLRYCGFTIQFNVNDFICKDHFQEMTHLLPCYRHIIPVLKRECGAKRCGPYSNIDNMDIGHARGCHTLICDIKCTANVLIRHCANEYGRKAAHFIMNYTSQQVSFWMKELNDTIANSTVATPSACSRLICHKSDLSECFW